MKDYAKIDTSPKMNKYEMAYYCITFSIAFLGLLVLILL
jgi:hypothetical protein